MGDLGIIDIALYGLIAFSAFWGMFRGLTHQVISLLFLIIGYFAARHFAGDLAVTHTNETINTAYYAAAFAGIFFGTVIVGIVVNFIVTRLVNVTPLVIINKALGIVFGVAKGVLYGMVAVFIAQYTSLESTSYWQASTLVPHYQEAINYVGELVGDNVDVPELPSMPTTEELKNTFSSVSRHFDAVI